MPSVYGEDDDQPPKGYGVYGKSDTPMGVYGRGSNIGVYGRSNSNIGVYGRSNSNIGVYGRSNSYNGVGGMSDSYYGVDGYSGSSNGGPGVYGESNYGPGVGGYCSGGPGVYGSSSGSAVAGHSDSGNGLSGFSNSGFAAYLTGDVRVTGTLQEGGGSFKIDHPLDPANKYLFHSFVESLDMKNVYDGVVVLDANGGAEIELPDWFSALNKDFRYQLTAIGTPGPNLYVAEEISETTTNYKSRSNSNSDTNSCFKIGGVLKV